MLDFEREDDDDGHAPVRASDRRPGRWTERDENDANENDTHENGADGSADGSGGIEVEMLEDHDRYGEPQHERPTEFKHQHCYGEPQHEPSVGREFRYSAVKRNERDGTRSRRFRRPPTVGT